MGSATLGTRLLIGTLIVVLFIVAIAAMQGLVEGIGGSIERLVP